jgi:hypothetical protein
MSLSASAVPASCRGRCPSEKLRVSVSLGTRGERRGVSGLYDIEDWRRTGCVRTPLTLRGLDGGEESSELGLEAELGDASDEVVCKTLLSTRCNARGPRLGMFNERRLDAAVGVGNVEGADMLKRTKSNREPIMANLVYCQISAV